MNKHIFDGPLLPVCRFCGKISGLDGWQIVDMPISMAICDKSTAKISWWERLKESTDCLGDW